MSGLTRLLCIDQFGEPGGGQVILGDVVQAARDDGVEVHVALPAGSFADVLADHGATIHDLAVPSLHGHHKTPADALRFACGLPALRRDIGRIAADVRPQLIHVNGGRVLPPAVAARTGCPLTFHAHTAYADGPTVSGIAWALGRDDVRRVIVPSPFMRTWAHRHLGVAPEKLALVWNWVDDRFFDLVRTPEEAASPVRIVVIGRITPVKGQELAVAAFKALPAGLEGSCRLDVCGPVDEETEGQACVRRLDGACATADGITVSAFHADTADVLRTADICLVPSLFDETFGLVAAEAMAAGVPVIVADSGALPQVVGDCGIVVPAGDVGALTAALEALIGDEKRRRVLGAAGRERARALFERTTQAAAVLEVLRDAAGEGVR